MSRGKYKEIIRNIIFYYIYNKVNNIDYISLTDKNPDNPSDAVIKWMSNKSSLIFIHYGNN